jgi:hypothetical protein
VLKNWQKSQRGSIRFGGTRIQEDQTFDDSTDTVPLRSIGQFPEHLRESFAKKHTEILSGLSKKLFGN